MSIDCIKPGARVPSVSHCRAAVTRAAILSEQTPIDTMTRLSVVWVCCVLLTVTEASCPFEGKQICEGAVTKELSTLVKICVDGKLKLKTKSDICSSRLAHGLHGGGITLHFTCPMSQYSLICC